MVLLIMEPQQIIVVLYGTTGGNTSGGSSGGNSSSSSGESSQPNPIRINKSQQCWLLFLAKMFLNIQNKVYLYKKIWRYLMSSKNTNLKRK